jgi:hypothetical protein
MGEHVTQRFCTVSCSPLTHAGCPQGNTCQALSDGASTFTLCFAAGALAHGAVCERSADCQQGYLCQYSVSADATQCVRQCSAGDVSVCTTIGTASCATTAFSPVYEGQPIGACQ